MTAKRGEREALRAMLATQGFPVETLLDARPTFFVV